MRQWYLSLSVGDVRYQQRNKYIKHYRAPSWNYLQDYTGMQFNKT